MRDPRLTVTEIRVLLALKRGVTTSDRMRFRNVPCRVRCCLDEHDDKLLSAVARDKIDDADRLFENYREFRQHPITGGAARSYR